MKNKIIIITGLLLCINSCRLPSSPLGEIKIIKRLETINTGGDCLDIDVDMDIEDSILVAAANYNGFFIYNIESNDNGILSEMKKEPIHIEPAQMDNTIGDNRAQKAILSKINNIAFIFCHSKKKFVPPCYLAMYLDKDRIIQLSNFPFFFCSSK